jgi:glucose-6-phosphate 1-dehydrogenase
MSETRTTDNPLRDDARLHRAPPPCALVIFGASGDLAHRKLLPSVYSMARKNLLPAGFAIVGVARTEMDAKGFQDMVRESLEKFGDGIGDEETWKNFCDGLHYIPSRIDASEFQRLEDELKVIDETRGTGHNRLYYLAIPPQAFSDVVSHMNTAGMNDDSDGSWTRLIIEKPFGHDLQTARELNRTVHGHFDESQVFRIDHYLGKETVQNLLVLRFANGFFEPSWDRRYIDHVQITVAEDIGIGHRAGFYDSAGALRDIVQNHLLQVLCITAMEPPVRYDADSLRAEKLKVLQSIRRMSVEDVPVHVVRGQYGPGTVGGEDAAGYRQEEAIPADSTTETFVAWKIHVDNWRWADTPFYIRTGKRLPRKTTEVALYYRQPPHSPFSEQGAPLPEPNVLVIRIQPEEGVTLRFGAKVPVPGVHIRPVSMDFLYGSSFTQTSPDAYERLILDAMLGDATLFPRYDEVEEAWEIVTPIQEWFGKDEPSFPNYAAGTWGPEAAHDLITRDGRRWHRS